MASKLSMALSSDLLRVEAGGTTAVTITLRNLTSETEQYVIAVEGIDPFWYQASSHSVAIPPHSQSEVQLSLHPPRGGDVRIGPYPLAVKAISRSNPDEIVTVELVLQVEPRAGLELELEPRVLTGPRERGRVHLTNWSEQESELVLSGRDRDGSLQFDFQPSFVALQHGQSVDIALKVRPKRGRWLRRGVERDFQIMAAPRGVGWDAEQSHVVSGVLVDKSDLSSARGLRPLRIIGLAAVAALLVVVGAAAWAAMRSGTAAPASDPAAMASEQSEPATTPLTAPAPAPTSVAPAQVNPAAGPPMIQRFVAQRAEDKKNIMLSWDVLDAEEIRLNGNIVSQSGSQPASMDRDGAYVLVAKNKGGTSTSSVYVVAVCPPSILSFEISPSAVAPGETATLSWDSFGASRNEIDGSLVPPQGNVVIAPTQSTRYVLTSANEVGTSRAEAFLEVTERTPTPEPPIPDVPPPLVPPPPVMPTTVPQAPPTPVPVAPRPDVPPAPPVRLPPLQLPSPTPSPVSGPPLSVQSFTATPQLLTHWGSTTLSWNVSGATAVTIEPDVGSVSSSGTRSVVVPSTTSFVLTAISASGQKMTRTADVTTIDPPYIVAVNAPAKANAGSAIDLSWNTTGTSGIVISWTDDQGGHSQSFTTASGSVQVTPVTSFLRAVTFTLTAKNQAGTVATAVRTVTIVRP